MKPSFLLAATALLGLAACSGGEDAKKDDGPPPPRSVTKISAFMCEGEMQITAIYGTNKDGQPDLELVIEGDNYQMTPTPAPEGARYATPKNFRTPAGVQPEKAIIWWELSPDNTLLQEVPFESVDDMDAAKTLRICKEKFVNDVS